MVNFQTVEIAGFISAIAGMRHPLKSYNKADTKIDEKGGLLIGDADYNLAKKLIQAGSPEHAKFLRQIGVWVNITAPRFWWAEEATYKIGTTENSQSTMHTLIRDGVKPEDIYFTFGEDENANNAMLTYIQVINDLIDLYKQLEPGDIKEQYFEKIKAMLPEGFLQTRMVSLNYQVLRNMYNQRKSHRLSGWREDFVNWVHTLPMQEWITGEFPDLTQENAVDEQ
jgi:hypothetical protein